MTKPCCVAVVRASATTIIQDYARLLDHVGIPPTINGSTQLQISIDRRYPFPGSSAPPWQTDGVARALAAAQYLHQTYQLSRPDSDDWHGHVRVAHSLHIGSAALVENERPDLLVLLGSLRRRANEWLSVAGLSQDWPEQVVAIFDATTIGNGPAGIASHPQLGNFLVASNNLFVLHWIANRLLGVESREHGSIQRLPTYELIGDTELFDQRWMPIEYGFPATLSRWANARQPEYGRWSKRDQELYTSWLYDTEWGRLFRSYHRRDV